MKPRYLPFASIILILSAVFSNVGYSASQTPDKNEYENIIVESSQKVNEKPCPHART